MAGVSDGERARQRWHGIRITIAATRVRRNVFRQRIEQLMGSGLTMLEMFARERHPGWDFHGDEAPGGPDVVL